MRRAIILENIPQELKLHNQWVLWKTETRNGKPTKVPYQPNHQPAKTNDPQTFSRFITVVERYKQDDSFDGIGFVFTKSDPFLFIDFDHCRANGSIDPPVIRYLKLLNSYTEISQSGQGIHVIVKAKLPEWSGNRKDNIEIYDHARFAVMTGERLMDYPDVIEARQTQLEELCRKVFGEPQSQDMLKVMPTATNLSDDQIIELCSNARNGEKFKRLFYDGDWRGLYPSQSEADLALASLITFYTINPEQIERIIRRSKLWDVKWEREDYPKQTIEKAIKSRVSGWQKEGNHNPAIPSVWERDDYAGRTIEKAISGVSRFFDNNVFIPKYLADEVMNEYQFICVNGLLYVYISGVWRPIGDDFVEQLCYQKLGQQARANRVTEVVKYIRAMTRTEQIKLNTHKDLINVKNGMLDWRKRELNPHDPNYYSTIQIPVSYDRGADNTDVEKWLDSIFGGDKELKKLACELFGYCLIPDTTMCKAFMLVGSGSNGKSTFLTVLEQFIGKDNVSKVPLQELADHRFKRADLFGKLVNLFADLDNRSLDSTTYFKTIVSGDPIDAERKHRDPFYFEPFARLIFSANEIPRANDRSYAYYRRWCIIPFEQKFEGEKEIKGYAQKLCQPQNLSALLNYALDGLQNIMSRQRFTEPQKVKDALSDYEKQNDPIKAFLDDTCLIEPENQSYYIERSEFYSAFLEYCAQEGYKTLSRQICYNRIRALGVSERTIHGYPCFVGLKIKNDKEDHTG